MEEIINAEPEKDTYNEYMPKKGKQSSINYRHRIRYFDWTLRLMRVFICLLIIWLMRKLIKNPIAVIKKWITF
jgi:hypothetical protein